MSDPEVIRPRATTDVRVWSRFVVPGGIKALQDYPGHKGSVEALRAVASYALSKPQE